MSRSSNDESTVRRWLGQRVEWLRNPGSLRARAGSRTVRDPRRAAGCLASERSSPVPPDRVHGDDLLTFGRPAIATSDSLPERTHPAAASAGIDELPSLLANHAIHLEPVYWRHRRTATR
jgi:hypothetical protein